MSLSDDLASIEVSTPDGTPVALGSLWRDRPVVLVFIRHFGWIFCREQVSSLQSHLARFRERGADLVVVGNGSPDEARAFIAERGVTVPVLVDPRMRAYRAAGMRRGVLAAVNLKVLGNARRAAKEGFHQGATAGDPWQLGGAFVILPDGRVPYEQRSEVAGDHADVDALLAAIPSEPVVSP